MASFELFLPLPSTLKHLETDQHAGERLFEILDAKPETVAPVAPLPFPAECTIKVEKLSITYPSNATKALDRLTFAVLPEELRGNIAPVSSNSPPTSTS